MSLVGSSVKCDVKPSRARDLTPHFTEIPNKRHVPIYP